MGSIHAIFPIPVYTDFYTGKNIDFLDTDFEKIQYEDAGFKSKNHCILEHETCSTLKSFILDKTNLFCSTAFSWTNTEYKISQSWISYKNSDQSHIPHYHPNSVISGVFYFLEHDDSTGNLILHRPNILCQLMNQFAPSIDDNKVKNSDFIWSNFIIEPRKNLLVLFPSWLHHSVAVNNSKSVRKSLAFNIIPKLEFGNEYSSTCVNLNE